MEDPPASRRITTEFLEGRQRFFNDTVRSLNLDSATSKYAWNLLHRAYFKKPEVSAGIRDPRAAQRKKKGTREPPNRQHRPTPALSL
jgi:hypothetical protein